MMVYVQASPEMVYFLTMAGAGEKLDEEVSYVEWVGLPAPGKSWNQVLVLNISLSGCVKIHWM